MIDHTHEVLQAIAAVRQDTLGLFKEIAKLTDAAAAGWTERPQGQADPTLALIRAAARDNPAKLKALLLQVAANDTHVATLTRELAYGL